MSVAVTPTRGYATRNPRDEAPLSGRRVQFSTTRSVAMRSEGAARFSVWVWVDPTSFGPQRQAGPDRAEQIDDAEADQRRLGKLEQDEGDEYW